PEGAVDGVHGPRHKARLRSGKPSGQTSYLLRSPVSLDGHETVHEFFHRPIGWVRIRVDRPRLNNVDRNPPLTEISCEAPRHALQGGLAKRVSRAAGERHTVTIH